MSVRRESDGADAERLFAGQQAYWRGEDYPSGANVAYEQIGWRAAAREAQRVLTEQGHVLRCAAEIRAALEQAGAAIAALMPARPTPTQRRLASAAQTAVAAALAHCDPVSPDRPAGRGGPRR
jgi:hypothetical protein